MLELLAGPFDILDLDGSAQALVNPLQTDHFQWDDDVGLIYSEGWLTEKIWLIQLDGTATERGYWFARYLLDIQNEKLNTYLATNPPYEGKLYDYDKRSGTYRNQILSVSGATPLKDIQVRCDDRFLGISGTGSQVRAYPLDLDGYNDYVVEANLTGTSSAALRKPTWSKTRNMDLLALAYADGNIIYYDHVAKQQIAGAAYIGENLGAWYSARHNIWVKLTSARQVEVYAATPRPHTISSPTPADEPLLGRMTMFTARVVGDMSEPCPNETVDWSLAEGSVGHLSASQSRTDAYGYASIGYVAPVDSEDSEVTIFAEVKY